MRPVSRPPAAAATGSSSRSHYRSCRSQKRLREVQASGKLEQCSIAPRTWRCSHAARAADDPGDGRGGADDRARHPAADHRDQPAGALRVLPSAHTAMQGTRMLEATMRETALLKAGALQNAILTSANFS